MRDDNLPLAERIERALDRIKNGEAPMRCPVEATDPDVVLADCAVEIAKLQEAVRDIDLFIISPKERAELWRRWRERPEVQRALAAKAQADPGGAG